MKAGDLFLQLGVDSADFKTAVDKAAGEAGTAGSKAGMVVGAVAIGAAFAVVAKGALQAEEAQGKYMAATGKSREEAKKFVSGMDSLAGSAGTVGKSFEDIAAAGTMVEQQFGTTGQATTDLTKLVLEFSKATGQDATQAAADLEDTLSAYGLTASDAAGFTDELVASAQKYGTQVGPSNLRSCAQSRPRSRRWAATSRTASACSTCSRLPVSTLARRNAV